MLGNSDALVALKCYPVPVLGRISFEKLGLDELGKYIKLKLTASFIKIIRFKHFIVTRLQGLLTGRRSI